MSPTTQDARRRLPAVGSVLAEPSVAQLVGLYGRELVRVQVQRELSQLREELRVNPEADLSLRALASRAAWALEARFGRPLSRVLNATGVFLHTNLGRAPLPARVTAELPALLDASCDLELDLESGRRSERSRRARALLCALTGAEATLVVNNNAAALVLVLAVLAQGREVVVSRGELVEIGGSFRVPDILAAAGAKLVEVGTTNRTHRRDYEAAVGSATALLLRVFPSNYRVEGFTSSVRIEALVELGRERRVPVMVDEGSGLLRPHSQPPLRQHLSVAELVEAGCDLVCCSGDKLLGGPQCGLLVGRSELVEACRRHPLYRALRADRVAFATLESVLRLHLAGAPLPMDGLFADALAHRRRLAAVAAELDAEVVPAEAFLGGGSAPASPIPGEALALPDDPELLAALRRGEPPVAGYLKNGRLLLDLRTVRAEDDAALVATVRAAQSALGRRR